MKENLELQSKSAQGKLCVRLATWTRRLSDQGLTYRRSAIKYDILLASEMHINLD